MKLPDTYSELWPGRFLKADLLKGQKVTLTIKDIYIEELVGDKNKAEPKVIISFLERPLEYVCPKTNGFCMKKMWGNNPHDWKGKRVTWFGTQCKFGREDVDCLRIWGSPDIPEDMPITIPQGRKKPLEMTMHRTSTKASASAPAQPQAQGKPVDLKILTAFGILDWNAQKQAEYLAENQALGEAGILADLNRLIDEQA